uniref:Uncharacterized protein n=1 Tax=Solanum lycopersicum TaxID=4081 RepID=A0A3Q7HCA6_SOLLC
MSRGIVKRTRDNNRIIVCNVDFVCLLFALPPPQWIVDTRRFLILLEYSRERQANQQAFSSVLALKEVAKRLPLVFFTQILRRCPNQQPPNANVSPRNNIEFDPVIQ